VPIVIPDSIIYHKKLCEFDFAQISGTIDVVNGFTIIITNIPIPDMPGHISRGRAG
jgi:hypothetical protein